MNAEKINNFIKKYNLDGAVDSVLLTSDGSNLSVDIISPDSSLIGNVKVSDVNFPEGKFGIFATSELKKITSVLDDTVQVTFEDNILKFNDGKIIAEYIISDESIIPKTPSLKTTPEYNIKIELDGDFSEKFIKSKSAIPNSEDFYFESIADEFYIVIGSSDTYSNKIKIKVDAECDGNVKPIFFSASYFKSILSSNKDMTLSKIEISTDGLFHAKFTSSQYKSEYYLVQKVV